MHADTLKTLLLGDVYGDSGCRVLFLKLGSLIRETRADFVVVNGENACGGFGISAENLKMFLGLGVDVITSGNHIWQQEEIYPYLDSEQRLLRPANYGSGVHGHGSVLVKGIGVINLQGRQNMPSTEDPFKCGADIVRKLSSETKTIFVDFHAENTEEKEALAWFLDGSVTAVVGTHVHVQTADLKILPEGTAYITDLGMCGPADSVIGCDPQLAIKRHLTQLPIKAKEASGDSLIHGVLVESDAVTGKALSIESIVY